jgi:hypothetical protein
MAENYEKSVILCFLYILLLLGVIRVEMPVPIPMYVPFLEIPLAWKMHGLMQMKQIVTMAEIVAGTGFVYLISFFFLKNLFFKDFVPLCRIL